MAGTLDARDAARLTDFARALKAAARAVILYPDTHPAIAASLSRLTELTTPPRLSSPLRIGVTAETLMIGGAAPSRPDAAVVELAALLHGHLIGELTVRPDGTAPTWRTFLLLLGRTPGEVRAEGGIARLWTTLAGRHVDIREVDYAEVLRERVGGTAASWQQILANCLTGDSFEIPEELLQALLDGTTDTATLAEVVAQFERAATGGEGGVAGRTAALLRLLRGIVRAVEARAPDRVEPVMHTLAAALGELSPEALLALVSESGREEHAAPVVSQVMRRMPDGTVVRLLQRYAPDPGAPLERVAQAFQTLVVDTDRRERLVAMARDTDPSASGDGFGRAWQGVAERLLTQYSDEPFVSTDYARELTDARSHALQMEQLRDDPPERLTAWLGTVSTSELRRLDLLLVLDLLRLVREPERLQTLVQPLLSLLDDLFLVGDFEAAERILSALVAAADRSDDPRRAGIARGAVARVVAPATMRHIVGHLATIDDAQFGRAKASCLLLGEPLVRPLAEALAAQERSRVRERLTDILIGYGVIGRREVERLKNSANATVRRTAVYLLREFGGSDSLPELSELLDDAEPAVQREAVRAILKIGTAPGYGILEQALVDGTRRTREAIMQALGSPRDDRAAPLLVYILDHVDHTGPLGWVYARALDLLGQMNDPASVQTLRTALHRGEWWAPRRTAMLRRAAAAALARVGTPQALQVLHEAARNGSGSLRASARHELELLPASPARQERR